MNWTLFFTLIVGIVLIALAVSRLKNMKAFSFKNKRIEKRQRLFMVLCFIGLFALMIGLLPFMF